MATGNTENLTFLSFYLNVIYCKNKSRYLNKIVYGIKIII